MSERVSWETCPECRRLAAVGWLDGNAVEVDCPNGCNVTPVRVVSTIRHDRQSGMPGQDDARSAAWEPSAARGPLPLGGQGVADGG
ncbi:hypothetical protein [Trujillonella endophytica]|uniref:Uncharacterized protein n=1 Tax=Trujillonella endophytica TaxID=673521 RepID=A0A1H8SH87_9ACTN|nr:hypothetical protein [Trujillella endophytica]SEO77553.1 hypothetical protein SAMN05660991_01680 [Trujillella endophytica]